MTLTSEHEAFITNYVKALRTNNAAVFAGAGMSVSSGAFDWRKLLEPIAKQMKLDITIEPDLTALAQFFVDANGGIRGELNQILTDQYGKLDLKPTNVHRILARLPIQIYWTTNYDKLIEEALLEAGKTPDVKKTEADLALHFPKRDAIIYKMHGDIGTVNETVLTKHEYEDYNKTRELFSIAFKSDFVSRTFLFIGFSFTDPNLDSLISRIRTTLGRNKRPDYYFIKNDADSTIQHRQKIRADSLKQYGLYAIWISDYKEIELLLREVEVRYLRSTIFISGSADLYDPFSPQEANEFVYKLSREISSLNFKILSGFGLGIGSAVINGVLENMKIQRNQNLDNYILLRPFPQIIPSGRDRKEVWKEYREGFLSLAGIAIFIFGNKNGGKDLADGMEQEFDIAVSKGMKVIPIGRTGYVAEKLWQRVNADFEAYFPNGAEILPLFKKLNDKDQTLNQTVSTTTEMINLLNKN